jgi:3-oxoacid CoA-transferase subunit A
MSGIDGSGAVSISGGTPPEPPGSKISDGAVQALREVLTDGQLIAVGGFGLCGVPADLIEAVRDSGVRDLTIVSNNMGVDGKGLGILLETGQVRKVLASYVGENRLFAAQYLAGQLEVEFNPQGTLAERLRAGGAGIPAFYTATGVGTVIAEGKPQATFDGKTYLLERGIVADLGLVHAYRADPDGNLVYRLSARNFNPVVATASKITIVEAEEIVGRGEIDPDQVHTPGVFVDTVVACRPRTKDIERLVHRERPETNTTGEGAK